MDNRVYEFDCLYVGEFCYSCENVPCKIQVLNDDPSKGVGQVKVSFVPGMGIEKYLDKLCRTLEERYYGDYSEADAELVNIPNVAIVMAGQA